DYPLAPINRVGKYSDSMKKIKQIIEGDEANSDVKVKKLILDLEDKDHYVLHYRNLKLYLQLGYKLEKIYKILWYKQEPFLRPYIDFNVKMRTAATNEFHKNLFKLMINIIFGKTCENVRNYRNVEIINNATRFKKVSSNPLIKSIRIIQEQDKDKDYDGIVAVEYRKSKIVFTKPIAIGTAVLEISKYVMYNHYYNVLKKTYPDVRLLYTDTDSLVFQVQTEDLFADMIKYPELRNTFDSSNLPKTHPLYEPCIKNKGKYGCFKDETSGEVIEKFIGLRAKMYAVQYNEKLKKRAKGVKKCEVKKYMFDNYHKALMGTTADELRQEVEMNTLRSYN